MTPTCEQVANARMLADTLEKVAEEWPENFDMANWVESLYYDGPSEEAKRYSRTVKGERPDECGTTACALGWAPYALGIPKSYGDVEWAHYAKVVLGVEGGRDCGLGMNHGPEEREGWCCDWHYLFLNFNGADDGRDRGSEGAKAAAQRLREFADAHEDCE